MQKILKSDDLTTGPKLWVILARAHGAMASYVETCIAAEGLGLSDFMVLEVLLHKGPMTISTIGEKVLLANASMTAAVDRLEQKGWVVRQSSENDRRSKIVALTHAGRAFISELYAEHARDIEAVTSVLTQREQEQLRSLLKKLGLSAKAATAHRGRSNAGSL
jgi:MarR family 2-MHQ and catechol resistance regulon transcriptional repressor